MIVLYAVVFVFVIVGAIDYIIGNKLKVGEEDQMNDKGVVLNAAFAASAAFVFGSHLAYTQAKDTSFVGPMVVAKLVAGILALVLAWFLCGRVIKRPAPEDEAS